MQSVTNKSSPFAIKNIRLFIAFRIFFNARFYYPVFTILFLDFGLTMAQFALLNAIWAATIVELSLEEHDRVVLYVLGLSHLVNLLFAKVLMSENTEFASLDRVGSTTFHSQVETASTVIGEDPGLYYMIQRLNPFTPDLYEALRREFDELAAWILNDQSQPFTEMMMRGREWMSRPENTVDR